MPRLRPAPKDETPRDIEIEIPDESVIQLEADDTSLDTDTDAQKEAKREAAREYRRQKKEDDEARASETSELKKQLEEMRAAATEHQRQLQEAQQRQTEFTRLAKERERETSQYLNRAEEAEYHSVITAIAAAETENDSAARDLETALTNQDFKSATEATTRQSRAQAKLIQLEENKNILEHRKNDAIRKAKELADNPPVQQQRTLTTEQQIDAVNALLPSQKEWLKAHTDAWTDQRKNMRLQGAHVEAEDQGFAPGSKEYFGYLEERLGYKKAAKLEEDDEEDDEPPQRRVRMAAPPTRDAPTNSGKNASRTKVTLTPQQQEAAQIAGISPQEYAKQLLKYEDAKESGYYDN